MRIHALLHSALGGDIHLPHWAAARGHQWSVSLVPEAANLPGPDAVDFLVVLGGPMSAWEDHKHPWLTEEKRLLARYLAADRPVLGICLGAQLLADVLGASVYQGEQPEIGDGLPGFLSGPRARAARTPWAACCRSVSIPFCGTATVSTCPQAPRT